MQQQTEVQGKGLAEQLKQAQANRDFKDEDLQSPVTTPAEAAVEQVSMPDITFKQEEQPAQSAAQQQAEQVQEIRLGNRVFKSYAELQGYLEQLEQTKGRFEAIQSQFQPQPEKQDPEEDLENLIWSNPKKYAEIIEQRAVARLQQVQEENAKRKEIEERFYRTYSDLANAKLLVRAVTSELAAKNELAGLTEDAALSKIAQAARRELYAIRGQKMPTEELASAPVRIAGSSSGAQAQPSTQATKPKSMVEQLKSLRKRG
jgi:hypothetical protein